MAGFRVLSTLPLIMVMFASCSPWNTKTRQVSREQRLPVGDSAYIESHRGDGHNYGCSVIEFDGKGSFLGEDQFESALKVLDARLGWRGAQYLPVINRTNDIDPQLHADFGAELTDPKWNNSKVTDTIISPARYLSYWSIKDRAEFHVSRVRYCR